jgi:hypothetical protein
VAAVLDLVAPPGPALNEELAEVAEELEVTVALGASARRVETRERRREDLRA